MRYTAVDAFSGAGGLGLGLQKSGFEMLHSFDNDKICIETLKKNPKYFSHDSEVLDICQIDASEFLSRIGLNRGELDLLAGGPPCQGFSRQRTVGSDEDERNNLVKRYGILIRELLPKFFLMENVAGLNGKRGRHFLDEFIENMQQENYTVSCKLLDSQDFGVPQRRKRMIVVGEQKTQQTDPFYRWPEPTPSPPPTVRDVIGHLPPPPLNFTDHPDFPGHRADKISSKNRARLMALKSGQNRTDLPEYLLADCHKSSADKIGHRNVYGRMEWTEIAPTITARFDSFTRGKFGHPEQVRTISLYEGSLLQTFPSDYVFTGNKVDVARQIGNAVPPLLAEVLGKSIIDAIRRQKHEMVG